jgi:hypothetical protein
MTSFQPSLFCITVIDTKDNAIGNTCRIDKSRVTSFAKSLTGFLNFSYLPVTIENKNYTVSGLTRAINNIDAESNDIILFIYPGHGFSYRENDVNTYPQLALWKDDAGTIAALRENSINMNEVFNLITSKGARLNIVISGCFNTFVELPRYDDNKVEPVARPVSWNYQLATQLLV